MQSPEREGIRKVDRAKAVGSGQRKAKGSGIEDKKKTNSTIHGNLEKKRAPLMVRCIFCSLLLFMLMHRAVGVILCYPRRGPRSYTSSVNE